MGVIELDVADMTMAIISLAICVVLLTIKMFNNETRLNRLEGNDDALETAIEGLSERCDTHKKSIEYLSKSVRELNGVVEAAVKVKEQTSDNKPDTKALIGGWSTDDVRTRDDASCIGIGLIDGQTLVIPVRDTGRVLMNHGKAFANHWHGSLWTNDEGHIYELPEGCFISGDKSYEMDQ